VPVVNAKKADDDADPSTKNKFLSMFTSATGGTTMSFFAGGEKMLSAFTAPQSNKSANSAASNTVFVAGSTGRLGIRVVRELLAAGFNVRAGVRSQEKAEAFEEILDDLNETVGPLSRQELNRVKVVYCDLNEPETIAPAIGNASRVVCCVGAAESEFTNLGAPKLIDYEGTVRLINTAATLNPQQFILVTSLGTGKLGFPAGVLNLFGGILIWKRKAEQALEASGMPYLIVRPGGMERPKDNHKQLGYNVRLEKRDTLFGGTVSRLQIAELIASAVTNPEAAENKTVEVVAETKAPSVEYAALLSNERTEIVQRAREGKLEEVRAVRSELTEAQQALEDSNERLDLAREIVSELQSRTAGARAEAKEAQKEQGAVVKEAERAEAEVEKLRREAEIAALEAAAAKAVAAEAQRAVRESRVLTRQEISQIRDSVINPREEEEGGETKRSGTVSGFFGTFIKQAIPSASVIEQEEEEEEEEEAVVTKSATEGLPSILSGFLSGAQRQPAAAVVEVQEEEEEEQEEEDEEVASALIASSIQEQTKGIFGGISNFFQPQGTVYVDEDVSSTQQKPSGGAALKAAREARAAATAGVPAAVAAVEETPAPAPPALASTKTKLPEFKMPEMPAVFGGLGQKKESLEAAAARAEEERAAGAAAQAKAQAEAVAAAKAKADEEQATAARAAAAAAQAAAQAEAEAAAAKAKAEQEEQAARAEEERAVAAAAQAKKQAEEGAAIRAKAEAFLKAEKEAQAAAAVAAAEAKQREAASAAIAVENATQARAWIEAWRSRPVVAATSDAPDAAESDIPENVKEAKAWIAAWKAR
jgi:uncharacterized protein YbjT (DUF2867 family)